MGAHFLIEARQEDSFAGVSLNHVLKGASSVQKPSVLHP